jgi:hypothetical protein
MVVRRPLSSLIVAHCRAIVDALVSGRFHCQWWYCHQPLPAFTSSDNGWFLRLCSPPAFVVACCCAILDSLVATLPPGALVASRRPPLPFPSMVGCCGHRPPPTFIVVCRYVIVDSLVATLPPGALVASRRLPLPFPLMVGRHPLLSSSPRFFDTRRRATVDAIIAGRFCRQPLTTALRRSCHQSLPAFTSSDNCWLLRPPLSRGSSSRTTSILN